MGDALAQSGFSLAPLGARPFDDSFRKRRHPLALAQTEASDRHVEAAVARQPTRNRPSARAFLSSQPAGGGLKDDDDEAKNQQDSARHRSLSDPQELARGNWREGLQVKAAAADSGKLAQSKFAQQARLSKANAPTVGALTLRQRPARAHAPVQVSHKRAAIVCRQARRLYAGAFGKRGPNTGGPVSRVRVWAIFQLARSTAIGRPRPTRPRDAGCRRGLNFGPR